MATERLERRLAAILAADVVGYSRLVEANEAATLETFRVIKTELFDPTIAGHRGRLVKTTGDGFLAEFGSVVDALYCVAEYRRIWPSRMQWKAPPLTGNGARLRPA